ncbi:unnamed protein product [Penicillium bialowiezense]
MSLQSLGIRTPSVLNTVFAAQACFLFANGVYTISCPAAAASVPDSPMAGIPNHMVQAMGITSLSIGTVWAIAIYQQNSLIMWSTLPGRLFAAFIFNRNGGGWRKVAIFETTMAFVTGAALLWDQSS